MAVAVGQQYAYYQLDAHDEWAQEKNELVDYFSRLQNSTFSCRLPIVRERPSAGHAHQQQGNFQAAQYNKVWGIVTLAKQQVPCR